MCIRDRNRIERINYLLALNHGTSEVRKQWAIQAIQYLQSVGFTSSPHWNRFVHNSGLPPTKCFQLKRHPADEEETFLQKVISHKFTEALFMLESKEMDKVEHYQNAEKAIQLLIRSKDYKNAEDLEYRIRGRHPDLHKELPEGELSAYRRIHLLGCACLFIEEKYFDCCHTFFNYLNRDLGVIEVLSENQYDPFISNEEILLMVTISVLVSIPLDNYDNFIYLENMSYFFDICPLLLKCLKLLIKTKFQSFFQIWHTVINPKCCLLYTSRCV